MKETLEQWLKKKSPDWIELDDDSEPPELDEQDSIAELAASVRALAQRPVHVTVEQSPADNTELMEVVKHLVKNQAELVEAIKARPTQEDSTPPELDVEKYVDKEGKTHYRVKRS